VTTLFLVQGNLVRDLSVGAAASGANLLMFDVQDDQAAPIDSLVRARGFRVVQQSPIVPMRIAAVNGRSVAQLAADSPRAPRAPRGGRSGGRGNGERRAGWALTREYRSTFRDSLTSGEQITSGRWFGAAMRDTAALTPGDTGEVSLDKGLAGELRVHLGDVITWNVQGVPIPTRVTSLRDIKWTRFEPNFFAVFPTRVLRDAPHQYTVLASVPGARNVATVQRDVVRLFPNVSSIDLSLITETIGKIVGKVSTAVRFMALFTLLMSIPVLFSAVTATRRERMRESVLLKTLGATRAQVVRILLTEYALLGTLGALTGFVLALGAGWALIHFLFKGTYSPALLPAVGIAAAMIAVAVVIGVLAGREVFRETAMSALRQD
jgi:putative ABC transport system permease protein